MAYPAPFTKAILAEATAIAPGRNKASDGTVGDADHQARTSDHNPDSKGMTHAADVTHDTAGQPQERFDAHAWGEIVRARCKVGRELRIKYLVSHDFRARTDIIASANSNWDWRRKKSNDHANHLHVSIVYLPWVEQSTAPLFLAPGTPQPPTPQPQPQPSGGRAVDVIAYPIGTGYYVVKDDGSVFAYGSAADKYFGGSNNVPHAPIVDMAVRPQGDGYWQLSMDGGIYAYGAAPFLGAPNTTGVARLYSSITPTPDGQGYYVFGRDGAGNDFIGAYGSAQYLGRP